MTRQSFKQVSPELAQETPSRKREERREAVMEYSRNSLCRHGILWAMTTGVAGTINARIRGSRRDDVWPAYERPPTAAR